jgi:hypothetical protein
VAWNVQQFWSEARVTILGQVDHVNLSIGLDSVDLYPKSKVACYRHDLGVVALHIELLNFSEAESRHISHKVLKQNRILLQVRCAHEPSVHNDVVGFFMVAKLLVTMGNCVLRLHVFESLKTLHKDVIKIFNCDQVVAPVRHQVVFAILYDFEEIGVGFPLVVDEVLEKLEEECAVEAVSITAESADLFVAGVKTVETFFKFVVVVFVLQHAKVE